MSTFEPPDFNLVHGSFEVVDIYTTAPFNTASDNRVATIFYNSNGAIEVNGGCLFMAPEVQTKWNWKEARREVVRTLIKILTTTRAVIEFERRPGGGYTMITDGYRFGQVDRINP